MKNSKIIIGALAVILSVTFACKKQKEVKLETEQQFSVAIQKGAFKGENENAIVVGSKAELEALFSGKTDRIYLKKASEKNNLFRPVVGTGTTGPVDPVDPINFCWDEINNYYQNHFEQWQAIANQTCKPYMTCITCPNSGGGLYVMYVIKPDCAIANPFPYELTKFNFTDKEYESDKVSAYIRARK